MLKDTLIDFDPATGRVAHPPRQVFLELTGRCNLACVHCSKDYGLPEAKNERHMSLEVIDRIQAWIEQARFLNLNLVGEPLLAPHFEEVVRRAARGDAEVSFNTNAVLLNEERARFIVEQGVNSVAVSFDGTGFNQRVRGVPYGFVLERMEMLDRVRREAGSELPHLALAYTLFRDNIDELYPLLAEVLPKIRVHAVHVQPLIVFYETLRQQNVYAAPRLDAAVAECRELCARHGTEFVLFRSQFVQDERSEPMQDLVRELGPFSETYGCTDPFFEIKVRADGGVLACSYGREPLANVLHDDLDEIWNGDYYRRLRTDLHAQRFEGVCGECPYMFGSFENQEAPLRKGVHHSRADRFLGREPDAGGVEEAAGEA